MFKLIIIQYYTTYQSLQLFCLSQKRCTITLVNIYHAGIQRASDYWIDLKMLLPSEYRALKHIVFRSSIRILLCIGSRATWIALGALNTPEMLPKRHND